MKRIALIIMIAVTLVLPYGIVRLLENAARRYVSRRLAETRR